MTYLRLFDEDGHWIRYPNLMMLAGLSCPDVRDIEHAYETMVREEDGDRLHPEDRMSGFAERTKDKDIGGNLKQRGFAGAVTIELIRLFQFTNERPVVNAARRLVALDAIKKSDSREKLVHGTADSAFDQVKKADQEYRNTLHLQAALILNFDLRDTLENDERTLLRILGQAKVIERFIDDIVVTNKFRWSPLRIPERVPDVPEVEFVPLTDVEFAVSQLPFSVG